MCVLRDLLCSCVFLIVSSLVLCCALNFEDIKRDCRRQCDNQINPEAFNLVCDQDCQQNECHVGCDLIDQLTHHGSSCDQLCKSSQNASNRNINCVGGCNAALRLFTEHLQTTLNYLDGPGLVADTCFHDSVTLKWPVLDPSLNLSCLIQWRYVDGPMESWEYYKANRPLKVTTQRIENLHSYTKYQYRVAWIVALNFTPLFSRESPVIVTARHGPPESAPRNLKVANVGPHQVSVNWQPPFFQSGPLISYVLELIPVYPTGKKLVKELPKDQWSSDFGDLYYLFTDTDPSTVYTVTVAARNTAGIGPITQANVTTLPLVNTPFLSGGGILLSNEETLLRVGLTALDGVPITLVNVSHDAALKITGFAVYVEEHLLFYSNLQGNVYMKDLSDASGRMKQLVKRSAFYPTLLSVDWLHRRLYMLQDGQITYMDFEGTQDHIAVTGFDKPAADMQVDPFGGYLYWIQEGSGLYRIDLELVTQGSSPMSQLEAQLFYKDPHLRAFTIDHPNYRVLVPNAGKNTVLALSANGHQITDIRPRSQSRHFDDVQSITYIDPCLYWTTSQSAYFEEYHNATRNFYSNVYDVTNGKRVRWISALHPSAQPLPVPVYPVEQLEGLFKDTLVKLHWHKPRLLGGLGRGSWQQWQYDVEIYDHTDNRTITTNVTSNFLMLEQLKANTMYSVKVRAFTTAGSGPWSDLLVGKTLRRPSKIGFPLALVATQEELLKTDVLGDSVQHLVTSMELNNSHVLGIAAYGDDQVFLLTNRSRVFAYDMRSHRLHSALPFVTDTSAIAVDWLAPKIYWACPVRHRIARATMNGSQLEWLPLLAVAQQLVIDAPAGFLYWISSHSVESSTLNGEHHQILEDTGLFSGKQVMGIVLDIEGGRLIWMVRNFRGATLFQRCTRRVITDTVDSCPTNILGTLQQHHVRGPVWYHSDRLYWLHEVSRQPLISTVDGHHLATLPTTSGVHFIAILDPDLQPMFNGSSSTKKSLFVVPQRVPVQKIKVIGTPDNFNIVWPVESRVNHGTVFYELKISIGENASDIFEHTSSAEPGSGIEVINRECRLAFPRIVDPYTQLGISLRVYTYWSSTKPTVVTLFSPMAPPSAPLKPRVFISHRVTPLHNLISIDAEFRWRLPQKPNGVIVGYHVRCWTFADAPRNTDRRDVCDDVPVKNTTLAYRLPDTLLKPNTDYYFRVRGATPAGEGAWSEVVHVNTREERPIPKLLIANVNAVKLSDVDTQRVEVVSNKATHPIALTYLMQDSRVFWLEETGHLMTSTLNGSNVTIVRNLAHNGTGLTIDWVSRHLYWSEVDHTKGLSYILAMDLNRGTAYKTILTIPQPITSLEADPFTSSLVYAAGPAQPDYSGGLMVCNTNGTDSRPLFAAAEDRSRRHANICTCNPNLSAGKLVTMDRSSDGKARILFVDSREGHIWASDFDGCHCTILVNATQVQGLPPTSLTSDSHSIYWSNMELGAVFSADKSTLYGVKPLLNYNTSLGYPRGSGIRRIRSIQTQRYPPVNCIVSTRVSGLELSQSFSDRVILTLKQPPRPHMCSAFSAPGVFHNVWFGPTNRCNKTSMNDCFNMTVYNNNTVSLWNLEPFTNYSARVESWSSLDATNQMLSEWYSFKTNDGIPDVPSDVKVWGVHPTRLLVHWRSPKNMKAHALNYKVHWKQRGMIFTRSYPSLGPFAPFMDEYSIYVDDVIPGSVHSVAVSAISTAGTNQSEFVNVTTPPFPEPLRVTRNTSRSLDIAWTAHDTEHISSHIISYRKEGDTEWIVPTKRDMTQPRRTYLYHLATLTPMTRYEVRLNLTYRSPIPSDQTDGATFVWLPGNRSFVFETTGDVPDIPEQPHLELLAGNIQQLEWLPVASNSFDPVFYELQAKSTNDSSATWQSVYNGSHCYWSVRSLPEGVSYQFRLRGSNSIGFGLWGPATDPILIESNTQPSTHPSYSRTSAALAVLLILACTFIGLFGLYMTFRRRWNKQVNKSYPDDAHQRELELATLRELPTHGSFIHENNQLYISDISTDAELNTIPHLRSDQIIKTKFLGAGAFGQVYEGMAYGLKESDKSQATRVAVKSLKKDAKEQETAQFLKEAKLMSVFKHEHVLRLLGICMDGNKVHLIIMELMDADLRSYLRFHRRAYATNVSLTLDDQLSICVDVAKGLKYLETLRFVHRDIAARNCLVSTRPNGSRVVKIGDFGLARDIYKNDYYRKEGEGPLPVRWMAPEALIDGVFSNQSDVWAFGVLMWEVMTLGEQPYPARNNLEVLELVRNGGKLDCPATCPADLYDLMVKCWSFEGGNRPKFCGCLSTLEYLRQKYRAISGLMNDVRNHNYITSDEEDGVDNFAYCCNTAETLRLMSMLNLNLSTDETTVSQCTPARIVSSQANVVPVEQLIATNTASLLLSDTDDQKIAESEKLLSTSDQETLSLCSGTYQRRFASGAASSVGTSGYSQPRSYLQLLSTDAADAYEVPKAPIRVAESSRGSYPPPYGHVFPSNESSTLVPPFATPDLTSPALSFSTPDTTHPTSCYLKSTPIAASHYGMSLDRRRSPNAHNYITPSSVDPYTSGVTLDRRGSDTSRHPLSNLALLRQPNPPMTRVTTPSDTPKTDIVTELNIASDL